MTGDFCASLQALIPLLARCVFPPTVLERIWVEKKEVDEDGSVFWSVPSSAGRSGPPPAQKFYCLPENVVPMHRTFFYVSRAPGMRIIDILLLVGWLRGRSIDYSSSVRDRDGRSKLGCE